MADSQTKRLAGEPRTRLWGRVLASARYRHPGDVIRRAIFATFDL